SGESHSSGEFSLNYGLSGDNWVTTSGAATSDGSSSSHASNSGTGSYVRASASGTSSGSAWEDSHDDAWYAYHKESSLNASGDWTSTGSGSGGTDGHSHSSYSGSGTYSATKS